MRVTKTQLEKVRQAVATQRKAAAFDYDLDTDEWTPRDDGPSARAEWAWTGWTSPAVVWEEGPFEWAHLFPYGGVEEEFGFNIPDVSAMLPKGVWCEAATSWAIHVIRDEG